MSITDPTKPEWAEDIQHSASGVIWTLSKRPRLSMNYEEDIDYAFVNDQYTDVIKLRELAYYQHALFNVIEWLSGIACDDWWWGDSDAETRVIVEEIKEQYVIAICQYFQMSDTAWKSFCDQVCDRVDHQHVYGKSEIAVAVQPFDYKQFERIGLLHGLVQLEQKSLFDRRECLVARGEQAS